VTVGDVLTATARVTNGGSAPVELRAGMTATGPAAIDRVPEPGATVAPGGTVELTWQWLATGTGTVSFDLVVDGTDLETGAAARATGQATARVVPDHSGGWAEDPRFLALTAVAIAPAAAEEGDDFEVVLEVRNAGSAPASLEPSILLRGDADLEVRESPPPAVVAAGGVARLRWTLRAGEEGSAVVVLRARWTGVHWAAAYVTAAAQVRIVDD
jgi:hypothetical protein